MLIGVLFAMHLGAGLCIVLVPLPEWLRIGLIVAVAVSLVLSLRQHGWRLGPQAVRALELDHEGIPSVRRGQNPAWHECAVRRAVIHPWVVLLWLQVKGQHWPLALVLAADAVEPEAFRRLRARLLLETRAG